MRKPNEDLSVLKHLEEFKVGMSVYWKVYKRPFKVQARNERYVIVTRLIAGNPKPLNQYSILDLQEGECSRDDRIFSMHDYRTPEDCEAALISLEQGDMFLSKRALAKIEDVVDLKRTFEKSIVEGQINMFTKKQLDKIGKKYAKVAEVGVWEYAEGSDSKIEVYYFGYQAHGKPGRISDGMIAMNRLTDEQHDRPADFWLAHRFETSPGWNICIMVSDHWLETHKGLDQYKAAWEQEFKEAK